MNQRRKEDIKQQWFVIRKLSEREIKRKYARSKLGILWSVLSPLLHMTVMSLIFSYMFSKSIDKYPTFWLTGHLFWDVFHDGTLRGLTALSDNKTLLIRTKYPKEIFILSRVYTSIVNCMYTLIPYVLILIVFQVKPTWSMFCVIAVFFCCILFTIGISYILSILNVFFGDIKHLYSAVVITLLFYMSALFYPATNLPDIMYKIVYWNPTFIQIEFARECMLYNTIPALGLWLKMFGSAFIAFAIGKIVFRKYEGKVLQVI